MSHLIGLYPGDLLDPEQTPELWRAAEVSLERRLAAGGAHTGWSRAWTACLFARLGRAEDAWQHLNHLITDFATDSLLDLHPPRIFQIDGNLGGAAAVIENAACRAIAASSTCCRLSRLRGPRAGCRACGHAAA